MYLNLSYITEIGEVKMENAKREQDATCSVSWQFAPPYPYLSMLTFD
jgi:hypothetical protein